MMGRLIREISKRLLEFKQVEFWIHRADEFVLKKYFIPSRTRKDLGPGLKAIGSRKSSLIQPDQPL